MQSLSTEHHFGDPNFLLAVYLYILLSKSMHVQTQAEAAHCMLMLFSSEKYMPVQTSSSIVKFKQIMLEDIQEVGPLDNHPQKYKPYMPFLLKLKEDIRDTGDQFKKLRSEALKVKINKENQEIHHGFKKLGLAYIPTSV